MYASITNFIAQNEMQMDMWIEFFKSQSAKLMTDAGAIQISITKTAPNKAVLMLLIFFKDVVVIKPNLILLLVQRSIISVTPSLGDKFSDKNFSKYSSFFE